MKKSRSSILFYVEVGYNFEDEFYINGGLLINEEHVLNKLYVIMEIKIWILKAIGIL